MPKLSKLVAIFLALSSGVTFAETATSTQPLPNVWQLGVTGLYLQPSFGGNGLGYSTYSNYGYDLNGNLISVNGAVNHLSNIQPSRQWAFALDGSYGFGNGNDVDISWFHLNNNTNDSLPQGTLFAGSASALYAGNIKLNTSWDAVNVVVGQRINFSDTRNIRLHIGLQGADINAKFTNFPRRTPTGNPIFITTDNLTYRGIGPRAGGEFNWLAGRGFGVYIQGAGSLLVGTARQSVDGYRNIGGFNLYSTGNYNQSNHGVVVPELEGKLGIKYDYPVKNAVVGLDVGYLWVTYLNALVSQVGSGVVSSAISNSSASNFNMNGLACTLTVSGNI